MSVNVNANMKRLVLMIRLPRSRLARSLQGGLSLVELLLALGLGLLIAAVASAVFLSSRTAYLLQSDSVQLSETGRYAIDSLTRAVRQAGFTDLARPDLLYASADREAASVHGLDAQSLKSTTAAIEQPLRSAVNGSDVLALRFAGTDDGSVRDCAGFVVPAAAATDGAAALNGWSIFYVAVDQTGEPELHCKYHGRNAWASAAIARGIESFQVLYGLGVQGAALPIRFITATQIDALDDQLVLRGDSPQQRAQDKSRQSHWHRVSAIRIALLLCSTQLLRADSLVLTHDLFGQHYSQQNSISDPGTRISESTLPLSGRNRLRKIFITTIQLRNVAAVMQ